MSISDIYNRIHMMDRSNKKQQQQPQVLIGLDSEKGTCVKCLYYGPENKFPGFCSDHFNDEGKLKDTVKVNKLTY